MAWIESVEEVLSEQSKDISELPEKDLVWGNVPSSSKSINLWKEIQSPCFFQASFSGHNPTVSCSGGDVSATGLQYCYRHSYYLAQFSASSSLCLLPTHTPALATEHCLLWASWLIPCRYKSTIIMPHISHLSSGLYKFSSPGSNESWDKVFICIMCQLFQSNSVFITPHYKSP